MCFKSFTTLALEPRHYKPFPLLQGTGAGLSAEVLIVQCVASYPANLQLRFVQFLLFRYLGSVKDTWGMQVENA